MLAKHEDKEEVKQLKIEVKTKKENARLKKVLQQKKMINNNQPSILNFSRRRGFIDPLKKKKLDDSLVRMTVGMNRPFSDVENHFFRELLFVAEPNYICPSRTRHTANFDDTAKKVKEDLKQDIVKDITEAKHMTFSICSDHGTSSDQFRTKKNVVTVARTTKDFVIKKDTITMIKCEGSQTGAKIRQDVKEALIQGAGWKEDVKTNWVTDNESKQINARDPNKHEAVGMKVYHTGSCVDHTLELATEESIQQCRCMKEAMEKVRSLTKYMKDSSLARETFSQIMLYAGVEPLAIIKGTSNRWFFKYVETQRALLLKDHIDVFFDTYDIPLTLEKIEDEDWHLILVYENAMKNISEAAGVLEGELYPTASCVIPFLDIIVEDLRALGMTVRGEGNIFVNTLLSNLQSARRFPGGYKQVSPYNCLTLLDIRHADLYFSPADYEKAVNDLAMDSVYDEVRGGDQQHVDLEPVAHIRVEPQEDSFSRRRCSITIYLYIISFNKVLFSSFHKLLVV